MSRVIPKYPHRAGGKFIPLEPGDYEDGGAYPEIHVVQYPLRLGDPSFKRASTVSLAVTATGDVSYDAIVKQGSNKSKVIQSSMNDIKEKESDIAKIVLPEKDEEDETTKRTKAALEAIINSKISSGKVVTAAAKAAEKEEPNYIRYTPNPSAPGYKPEVKQRVIKMVEAQVDPMEPAKQTTVKASKPGADAPVPVLHAPSKKLTVAEKQAWDIPACVSNWKNPNGYTIALDKRLAADGRGLQETTINNKFAMLSEGLYVAERKAAEDLHVRNQLRKKMAMKEKEDKESMLREIAAKARMERAGIATDNGNTNDVGGDRYSDDDGGDEEGREERERLRVERRKERERELRQENMGKHRKNKDERDEGRDISEKIALGMLKSTGTLSGDAVYDSRLFNQSSGISAGFGAEDDYSVYSKPLFNRTEGASIYRPKREDSEIYGNADEQLAKLSDTSRFKADKGFIGTQGGAKGGRNEPVQFEKNIVPTDDPFGLDDLIAKKKQRTE